MLKIKPTKDAYYILIIALLLAGLAQVYFSKPLLTQPVSGANVFYNKETKLDRKIIQEIQSADKLVYFAIYTFTKNDIKDALLGAKHRGLKVQGITDKNQEEKIDIQKDIIKELRDAGIEVETQDHSGIMHLKTLVTDKAYISGSYNWTSSATNTNDEILEVGHDETLRQKYQQILEKLFKTYSSP